MADNTAKGSVLTDYYIQQLRGMAETLGLKRVYYGDQENIPEVPCVCVEPARVLRELTGTALRTDNEFAIAFLVYGASVEGNEAAQSAADVKMEEVVDFLNTRGTPGTIPGSGDRCGGLVIVAYVQSSEYGYMVKGNKLVRANRGIIYAKSKTNLLEA